MQVTMLYRPSQTVAQCWLDPEESLMAESGTMMGMSSNITIQTHSGGIVKGLKRMLGGESFFRNTFTAVGGRGEVLLTTPLCGDMAVLEVGQTQWYLANSGYIGSSTTVDVSAEGSLQGMFSGVGLFVLGTNGQGQMVIGSFGALERVDVDGEMIIDTGHLVAWDARLQYEVGKATKSGWVASWLSGEGLVCHFRGRGSVYIQSRSASNYGSTLGRMLPPVYG
jgi:uncharacterized protein (TIGR00266 family)